MTKFTKREMDLTIEMAVEVSRLIKGEVADGAEAPAADAPKTACAALCGVIEGIRAVCPAPQAVKLLDSALGSLAVDPIAPADIELVIFCLTHAQAIAPTIIRPALAAGLDGSNAAQCLMALEGVRERAAPVRVAKERSPAATGKFGAKTITTTLEANPRREGTHGHKSFAIIMANPGLTYEKYRELGGRANDLQWDLDHDYCKLEG